MEKIESLFELLNKCSFKYIVLRNYEDIFSTSFLTHHPDIDFLCDDTKAFLDAVKAKTKLSYDDGIHYLLKINNIDVPIDIREVGDGYYDKKWEEVMLRDRVLFNDLCYIPNTENYYYSLLYHAIVQKKTISRDYLDIFRNLEELLQINDKHNYIDRLDTYLRTMGYKYEYPNDICVGFNIKNCDKSLVEKNYKKKYIRDYFEAKQLIKRILRLQ